MAKGSSSERRGDAELPALAAEDHVCTQCAVAYADVTIAEAVEALTALPGAVHAAVAGLPSEARKHRPQPGVWSVTEYVCHLRDVYMTYTIRLHRTRTEDRPTLEPMFNDLRARRFRYNERDVEAVIDELASATAGFCDEVAGTSGDDWDRTASRLPGEERTALWLVRQAMHEGVHHLGDIRTISGTFSRL
jgi:uncharacterized damage-inducible protein DinB